jgi:septal ring factor EnvC (AmiA/AmiB activator)
MKKLIAGAAVLLAVLFFLFPGPFFAQQDLSDFEKRLSKLNEEIKSIQSRIYEEGKKESTVLSALQKISLNKQLIKSELTRYTVQQEKMTKELASLKDTISDLKINLGGEQASVEKTLVTLYKFGKFNFPQFLLQPENIETLFTESKHLTLLAQYQERVITDYLSNLRELGKAGEALEAKKKEIATLIDAAAQKKRELEGEEQKNQALVDQIRRSKDVYQKTLDELKTSTEQLQILMKKFINQEFTLPLPFVPLYEKKGKLPWPILGNIITRFGLQTNTRFNTTTLNNGIEVSPARDRLFISAVHPGKVAFADYFQGYGNLIILDHGMTYYSLYGHCSEFLVAKGDLVRAEQPIAKVGDSGSLNGTCLYFEIRWKTKPLDPLQWLKRR